jgi:hypothetical protein
MTDTSKQNDAAIDAVLAWAKEQTVPLAPFLAGFHAGVAWATSEENLPAPCMKCMKWLSSRDVCPRCGDTGIDPGAAGLMADLRRLEKEATLEGGNGTGEPYRSVDADDLRAVLDAARSHCTKCDGTGYVFSNNGDGDEIDCAKCAGRGVDDEDGVVSCLRQRDSLVRVREIHTQTTKGETLWCNGCGHLYPCPTITALDTFAQARGSVCRGWRCPGCSTCDPFRPTPSELATAADISDPLEDDAAFRQKWRDRASFA